MGVRHQAEDPRVVMRSPGVQRPRGVVARGSQLRDGRVCVTHGQSRREKTALDAHPSHRPRPFPRRHARRGDDFHLRNVPCPRPCSAPSLRPASRERITHGRAPSHDAVPRGRRARARTWLLPLPTLAPWAHSADERASGVDERASGVDEHASGARFGGALGGAHGSGPVRRTAARVRELRDASVTASVRPWSAWFWCKRGV
jgi:hypothetical protein